MNRLILFFIMVSITLSAQTGIRFINYGPRANPEEGDDNYAQVINIKIPSEYKGNAYLRLYDMSCGSASDIPLGSWDSRYRFSIYKNEFTEDNVRKEPGFKSANYSNVISHFEIGYDTRYFDNWYTFVNLSRSVSVNSVYSLLVEGVEGNDGNAFEIFISSDSLSNTPIDGVELYSYEPTISLSKFSNKISFKIRASGDDEFITLHTFDFDGTRTYFSSLLKNEIPNIETSIRGWNSNKYDLTIYEKDNFCSLDIGPQNNTTNDVTFYFTSADNTKFPIPLIIQEKKPAEIPAASVNMIFKDCRTVQFDVKKETSGGEKYINQWTFNDGEKSDESTFLKVFSNPGKYTGELFVLDTRSDAVTHARLEKFEITINEKPEAVFSKNIVGAPNEKILFDAGKSFDKDGRIVKYEWDFGDGSSAGGVSAYHIYASPGKYNAILKVTDDYSLSDCNYSIDSSTVIINAPPVPVTNTKISGSINEEILFDASKSNDSDGSIVKYLWDFKNFGVETGSIIKKKFSIPGKYKVTLTVQDNSTASNNSTSIEIDLFINAPPKAVAGSNKILAPKEEALFDGSKSIDSDGSIIEYKWRFGDGKTSDAMKIAHSYSAPGKYPVYLTVRDDSRTSTDTHIDSLIVIVNKSPVAIAGEDKYLVDGNASFDASRSYDDDGTITKFEWDFGDGSKSEGKITQHVYKIPGTYRVILKVTDNTTVSNSNSFDTLNIFINRKPIADAGPDLIVAPERKIKFSSANSTDPDGKIVKQKWYVDNKPVTEEKEMEYIFNESKAYLVGLEVIDDFKTPQSDIDFAVIKVNKAPTAIIDAPLTVVPNQKIKLSAERSSDSDGKILDYRWMIDNQPERKGKVFEHTFTDPGIHRVVLNVLDDANVSNSIGSDTLFIKVNTPPLVVVQDLITTCENVVAIDASRSYDPDGDPLTFYWQIPNMNREIGSAVRIINFAEKGFLPVLLSVDDGMGLSNSVSQKTIMVKINRPPVANAGVDTTVCSGDIVVLNGLKSFDPENGLLKYVWSINDSIKIEGSNAVYKFRKGGVYKIKLQVTDDSGLPCSIGEDEKIITVVEAPVANAGPDQTACANNPVQFDGTGSSDVDGIVNSYEWDFGDGEFGGGATPVHIYTKPGTYKVTLTITGDLMGDCDNTDKDEMIVMVVDAPVAIFNASTLVPERKPITFDASESKASSGKILKYEWNFGDGNSAEGKIVNHSYNKYGNYKVTLKIQTDSKGECSTAFASKQIIVNSRPIATASAPKNASVNQTIELSGIKSMDYDGMITNYYWDLGDGSTKEGVKINYAYSRNGKYRVILKVEDNSKAENNFDYDTTYVLINAEPKAVFNLPEQVYKNFEFILDASKSSDSDGSITSYEWYLNDQKISNEKLLKYKIDKPGIYRIRLLVKDNAQPESSSDEVTKYITVSDYPSIKPLNALEVCSSETFTLKPIIENPANDQSIKYKWYSTSGSEISSNKEYTGKVNRNGKHVYYLEISNNSNFIFDKDSIVVIVNTPPVIETISDKTIYIGGANDEIRLEANVKDEDGDLLSYEWNLGDGTISNRPVVIHKYKKEGEYNVLLTVNDNKNTSCSKTTSAFKVKVLKSK